MSRFRKAPAAACRPVASPLLAAGAPTAPPAALVLSSQPETGADDVTTEAANAGESRRKRRWEDTKVEEPATVQDSQLVEDPTPATTPVALSTTPVIPRAVTQAVPDEACSSSAAAVPEKARHRHCHTPSMWV